MSYTGKAATVDEVKTLTERNKATNTEHDEMLATLGINTNSLGVNLTHETFIFELEDGSTIEKELVLWPSLS